METEIKTSALILSRAPYRENDGRIISFTKIKGKMQLVATGLYKPAAKLSYSLLPGNHCYLTLSKGIRWHITGVKMITSFASKLFEPRLHYLSSIVRETLIELFPDEETTNSIYKNAIECFTFLASSKFNLVTKELVVYRFLLAAFNKQGLLPDFTKCARDGRRIKDDEERYWQIDRGLLCAACSATAGSSTLTLPRSIALVPTYTTKNFLSKEERRGITAMVQDIYSNEHKTRLESLAAWTESL